MHLQPTSSISINRIVIHLEAWKVLLITKAK